MLISGLCVENGEDLIWSSKHDPKDPLYGKHCMWGVNLLPMALGAYACKDPISV